jgi:hypothetical protein
VAGGAGAHQWQLSAFCCDKCHAFHSTKFFPPGNRVNYVGAQRHHLPA